MRSSQLRSAVAELARKANADLEPVWSKVSTPVQARDALMDILPALVDRYGSASATVAAVWYDAARDQRAVRGRFEAIVADLGTAGAATLAGWGVSPLFAAEPNWDAAKVLVGGGLQRRIANSARQTVMRSAVADPHALGWQRVGNGECDFCSGLLNGAVYSEAAADFAAHDHCKCAAEPAWH